jgi:uncharacterized protein with FMN-binding domain
MGIPLYKSDTVNTGECIECLQCVTACPRGNVSYSFAGSNVRPLLAGTMAVITITCAYGGVGLALAASQTAETPVQIEATLDDGAVSGEIELHSAASPSADTTGTAAPQTAPFATGTAAASASLYADGTYTGTGTGFRGASTQVSVTIQGGVITDITPVSTGDDAPYFDRAFSLVCSDIMSCQSASVDAVSGATYSSQGIMDAVQDALSQAAL